MNGVTAEERILDRIRSEDHHRIRVITGDLGRAVNANAKDVEPPSSVIDAATMQQHELFLEMSSVVDEVFHNASYLGLKKSPEERQKCLEVNVRGTKRLLDLTSTFKREIKALFYTSTAFVHGRLSGPQEFREDDALTNGWLNPYEESKWKAEELVRESGYPYRIFRPGMIAREPGANVLSSHTIYGVADVFESGISSHPISESGAPHHLRVRGVLDAAHNIILRSELIDMIFDIRTSKHEMSHTYNTLNPTNTRLEDVVYAILQNLDPAITFEFVTDIDQTRALNRIERLLEKTVYPVYEEYLFKRSPKFDMSNVKDALGEEYVAKHVTGVDRLLLTELMADYFRTKRLT
jgi:nucleoside-diphosphate-sugar epimerase